MSKAFGVYDTTDELSDALREIEQLRAELAEVRLAAAKAADMRAYQVEQLRTALQQIVAEADSDDGLTAWDGADIARRALGDEAP